MENKTYTGKDLEKALLEDTLTSATTVIVGMVKSSEKSGHISFAQANCDKWVDVPTNMIDKAEYIGHNACQDHTHATMRIFLKQPKEEKGKILLNLLGQVSTKPHEKPLGKPMPEPPFQGEQFPIQAMRGPNSPFLPGYGSGGFGNLGSFEPTLPRCGWKACVCNSPLPGYRPTMCYYYCCTWPSGISNCPC